MRPSVLRWQEFKNFVAASYEDFLNHCSADQLFKTAEKNELHLSGYGDEWRKHAMVRLQLFEKAVLVSNEEGLSQSLAA